MYNHIGIKVKIAAILFFILMTVSSVAGAIIFWTVNAIGQGFGVLAGGLIAAFFSTWVIYCVGDTNEKVTMLQEQLDRLQREKRNTAAHQNAGKPANLQEKPVPAEKAQPVIGTASSNTPASAQPNRISDDKEQCPFCGTVQNAGRNVCWNCGKKFVRGE